MTQRDREIVRRYKAGETQRAIAADYGINHTRVSQIVRAAGVTEGPQRRDNSLKAFWASLPPEGRYELLCKNNHGRTKPVTWPECPPEIYEDYRTLRQYFGAAEARTMLEAQV